ncbi:hypothetical protein WICPIJ_001984 [Wickerhamomyces pijperi]|uniref:Protein kinase domain-containing protein n=1 Tax=Wickerhamomyces pijperi TaxID=599730 RepID=A0A9P8QCK6_WICPI|nr:hypothetical protein WICPIJ_001984 [Wickerhamomyces pijperi]
MSIDHNLNGVTINGYQIVKQIGTGAYGLVYLAIDLSTGSRVAIKAVSKINSKKVSKPSELLSTKLVDLFSADPVLENLNTLNLKKLANCDIEKDIPPCPFLKEVCIHLRLHEHPNVISIHQILDFKYCIFIVMDYFDEGDLFVNIVDRQVYTNSISLIKTVFTQLVDVISYCHSRGVYHCDIKPENIMVAQHGALLTIGDFGLAVESEFINSNICIGSSYYMPPERLISVNHNLKSDVEYPASSGDLWSLTIILINLTCMRNPWMKASELDLTFKAYLEKPEILKEILPISEELYQILILCLIEDPFKRISLFELRDLVINCPKFTNEGPLSIPETPEEMIKYTQCLVPAYSTTSSIDSIKSVYFESPGESPSHSPVFSNMETLYKQRQLHNHNHQYQNEPSNVLAFLGGNHLVCQCDNNRMKDLKSNYSIMTNVSFNMNGTDFDQLQAGY